ncbi:CC_3452 family protein [Hyphobacterium sp.]|uniref:CC_3452 family protein n=1 Tax=Hyphobacterium sp. TaxID=2004662 RepID=UPI003BA90FCC
MRTMMAIAALALSTPVMAQTYNYTARTENPVLQAGQVRAGSLTWSCSGNACRISGPWVSPGVSACAQLAQIVGDITEYGHPGAQLNASQLRTCNANAAAPRVIQSPGVVRETIQRPVTRLPGGQAPQIDPSVVQPRQTVTAATTVNYTAPRITRQTLHIEPRPTERIYAIRDGGGDGDFGGNGPRVRVGAEILAREHCLYVQVDMIAEETRPDHTRGRASAERRIWCNPDGGHIERIVSSARASAEYTDTDWELDTLVPGRGEVDPRRAIPETEGPVRTFMVMGDTNGDIASNDNDGRDVGDLRDDGSRTVSRTSVQVQFNEIEIIVPYVPPVTATSPAGTTTITVAQQHTEFHIFPHTGGDREFFGNGPRMTVNSRLSLSGDGRRLLADISGNAEETGGDTRAAGSWTETLWQAPAGWRIDAVEVHYGWWDDDGNWQEDTRSALDRNTRVSFTDRDHEHDFLVERAGEARRSPDNSIYFHEATERVRREAMSPVSAFRVVGDTNGQDAGILTGMQAFYRPLIVTLSPTSSTASASDLEPDVFLNVPTGDYGNMLSGGNYCGPQAGSRVLRFYGVSTTYEQFKRRVLSSGNLVSDQSLGTPPGTLRDRMNDLSSGFVHDVLPLGNARDRANSLQAIRDHLDQGRPVITLIGWGSQFAFEVVSPHDAAGAAHWVVVRGYDDRAQTFHVIDNGHAVEWSYELFESLFDYGQDAQYELLLAMFNAEKGSIIYRR